MRNLIESLFILKGHVLFLIGHDLEDHVELATSSSFLYLRQHKALAMGHTL